MNFPITKCQACPMLGKDHVIPTGPMDAKLLVVDKAVTSEAKLINNFHPHVSELFDYMLDEAGLDISQVYITNVVKCRPPGGRNPSPEEYQTCRDHWLSTEISQINPPVLLLLGKEVCKAVTKHDNWFEHNRIIKSRKGITTLMSNHPGYFIRSGNLDGFIEIGTTIRKILNESIGPK